MLLDNIQKPRLAPARRWLATFLLAVTFSTSLLAQNRRIREHEVQRRIVCLLEVELLVG